MNFILRFNFLILSSVLALTFSISASADENLLGYIKGAETLPSGHWEVYQIVTQRNGKGAGKYEAWDTETEVEYGATDRLSLIASFSTLSINTSGILIDAYIPKDESFTLKPASAELAAKFNFLSPAKDDIGLATYFVLDYKWIDPHSGQKKDQYGWEILLSLQKYFLEGELIWISNFGLEASYAHRAEVDNLPAGFDWPTHPEMELEPKFGTGITYRFMPNWFAGAEALYETEYETEVGRERWSWFAGPTLHYGSQKWWATLTAFQQLAGNGNGGAFPGQDRGDLHLVEKTKNEIRLKVGLNF